MGLTLPTEAQWEYGCRSGTTTRFSCPENELELYASVGEAAYAAKYRELNVPEPWDDGMPTHGPVGSFLPNAFGFHDMHGSVWEWCLDGYNENEFYTSTRKKDPLRAPDGTTHRVRRGGGYNGSRDFERSSLRHQNDPGHAMNGLGVRPARAITAD